MRVAIHEPWHYHAAGRADFDRTARCLQVLNPARRADFLDESIAYQHRTVGDQSRIVQETATPGLPRPAHGKQLARAPNQYRARLFWPSDITIASVPILPTRSHR